jgi:hypothetical protein
MPVVGAVLQLSLDAEQRKTALCRLCEIPAITLGDVQSNGGCPLVIEFDSKSEEKAIWNEIGSLTGVVFSTVVYADFSDLVLEESGL